MHKMQNYKAWCFLIIIISMNISLLYSDWHMFLKPELGILKYHTNSVTFHNVSGNKDSLAPLSIKLASLARFAYGFEYDDLKMMRSDKRTFGRLGLAFEHSYRSHDSLVFDYLDSSLSNALLEGRQNINSKSLFLVGEYDFFKNQWFIAQAGIGIGVVHTPVTSLKLYQKSNNAFIGQELELRYLNPAMYIGFGFKNNFYRKDNLFFECNYRLGLAFLSYHEAIMQSKPDASADWFAQNAYEFLKDLKLASPPCPTLLSHKFSLGFQFIF